MIMIMIMILMIIMIIARTSRGRRHPHHAHRRLRFGEHPARRGGVYPKALTLRGSELRKRGRMTTGHRLFLQGIPMFQQNALSSYALARALLSGCSCSEMLGRLSHVGNPGSRSGGFAWSAGGLRRDLNGRVAEVEIDHRLLEGPTEKVAWPSGPIRL